MSGGDGARFRFCTYVWGVAFDDVVVMEVIEELVIVMDMNAE